MIINHPCLDTPLGKRDRGGGVSREMLKKMGMDGNRDKTERSTDVETLGEEKVKEVFRIRRDYFIIGPRSDSLTLLCICTHSSDVFFFFLNNWILLEICFIAVQHKS